MEAAYLVGTGGAIGAVLRYLVGQFVARQEFPLATLTVNVLGTFLLGFVTFSGASDGVLLFVGTGVCGSFTTYSSFSFETVRLWEGGHRTRAVLNAAVNLVLCLAALAAASLLAFQ